MEYIKKLMCSISENTLDDITYCDVELTNLANKFALDAAEKLVEFNKKNYPNQNISVDQYTRNFDYNRINRVMYLVESVKYTDSKHEEALLRIEQLEKEAEENNKKLEKFETIIKFLADEINQLKQAKPIDSLPNLIDL